MKKTLLLIVAIIATTSFTYSQTTATDFTTKDCNEVSHNLFNELDSGYVVVICWTMPCPSCAEYAGFTSDAVQSFAKSHPGKVRYYLVDDYANSTCSYLNGWAKNYNLTTDALFSSLEIKMSDYGIDGMPKTIVLGKKDHGVYYNKNDNLITEVGVKDAINAALSEYSVGINEIETISSLKLFPNPATDLLNITYNLKQNTSVKIEVLNMLGEVIIIEEDVRIAGNNSTPISVSEMSNGFYFMRITTGDQSNMIKFSVIH